MPDRTAPYHQFNFLVNLGTRDPQTPLGGFQEVAGLTTELVVSEYRNGNEKENHVRKVPGLHKVGDVTCKRGIVDSKDLWEWIQQARTNGVDAQRDVLITLLDEAQQPVEKWKLRGVVPLKYTGPSLNAKGGDIAMEELVLSAQAFEISV
jgi:phage tail-like protein